MLGTSLAALLAPLPNLIEGLTKEANRAVVLEASNNLPSLAFLADMALPRDETILEETASSCFLELLDQPIRTALRSLVLSISDESVKNSPLELLLVV